MKLQTLVFELLEKKKNLKRSAIIVQSVIGILIISTTIFSIWETVPTLEASTQNLLNVFQYICAPVFVLEYALRLWVAPLHTPDQNSVTSRLKFALKPAMLIDLTVLLPFILPFMFSFDTSVLRTLRLVRIMSIGRLGQFSKSINSLTLVIKNSLSELLVSLSFCFLLLIIAATGIYHFEKESQPEVFTSIPGSIWWAVNALTGIWLGDVYPVTLGGRIFAALVALLGVGIVALPAGIVASGIIDSVSDSKKSASKCPHCGEPRDSEAA